MEQEKMGSGQAKIMIVDDSEFARGLVTSALEERGYRAVSVDSVFDFNRIVREEKPDLVLIDVNMPALQGNELVASARRFETTSCPLVLFSTRPENELVELAQSCGATGYICKTDDDDSLISQIEVILARHRS